MWYITGVTKNVKTKTAEVIILLCHAIIVTYIKIHHIGVSGRFIRHNWLKKSHGIYCNSCLMSSCLFLAIGWGSLYFTGNFTFAIEVCRPRLCRFTCCQLSFSSCVYLINMTLGESLWKWNWVAFRNSTFSRVTVIFLLVVHAVSALKLTKSLFSMCTTWKRLARLAVAIRFPTPLACKYVHAFAVPALFDRNRDHKAA